MTRFIKSSIADYRKRVFRLQNSLQSPALVERIRANTQDESHSVLSRNISIHPGGGEMFREVFFIRVFKKILQYCEESCRGVRC